MSYLLPLPLPFPLAFADAPPTSLKRNSIRQLDRHYGGLSLDEAKAEDAAREKAEGGAEESKAEETS